MGSYSILRAVLCRLGIGHHFVMERPALGRNKCVYCGERRKR